MTVDRQITDPDFLNEFIRGGMAIISLRSTRTNVHFTYRITRSDHDGDYYYVARKSREDEWTYLGTLDDKKHQFRWTKATAAEEISRKSFKVFSWFIDLFIQTGRIHPQLEVFHDGRCAACSNWLTDPKSLDRGFGPKCWERHQLLWKKATG